MRRIYVSYAAIALMLSGCMVGEDYQSPEISPPQQFVMQEVFDTLNEGKETHPVPAEWWQGFEDPLLDRLVRDGLAQNYDIKAATARLKAAQAAIGLAEAGRNPQLGVSVESGIVNRREAGATSLNSRNNQAVLGGLLPLDVFGGVARQVEAAEAEYAAADAALRATILDTSTAIAQEYLRLRGTQAQLALLRESVALQEQTLKVVQSRYNAGLAPELDVRRAETSVENLRASIPPLEQSLANSRYRLAGLLGEYPAERLGQLQDMQDIPEYQASIPVSLPIAMLQRRPEVAEAEARLKQAIALTGVAEAAYYPQFSLAGSIALGTVSGGSAGAIDSVISTVSALIDQVLLDGGVRSANRRIAEAQTEEALALYAQSLREAVEDVENTLVALNTSQQRQETLHKTVAASNASFAQAELLYQQGLISFLDVVDAQRVLASAEQQLAAEQTNYATQIARLFRVLGGSKRETTIYLKRL